LKVGKQSWVYFPASPNINLAFHASDCTND